LYRDVQKGGAHDVGPPTHQRAILWGLFFNRYHRSDCRGGIVPILVRPVREQLEHDRIIRLLQARYQKKHDPVTNIGNEPPTSIVIGAAEFVPDLILVTHDKARKLEGVVEVETGESVNSLEALAQWGPFSKLRVPFHLYVPPNTLDTVRRLCRDHNVTVAELWTYHTNLDQVRFTLVQKAPDAALAAARKTGLAGTPKLKVAPPPAPARTGAESKAPVRTAAQKASFGKFVAAAKASAAKHAAAQPAPVAAPAASAAKPAGKAVAPAPVAAKGKSPVAPAVPAAPVKSAVANGKKPAPVAAPAPAKAAKAAPAPPPAKAVAAKAAPKAAPAAKPAASAKAAVKPAAKPVAKAAAPVKPVAKVAAKPVAKAAAAKPAPKAPAKPVAKKAAPAKAVARPAAGKRR